MNKEQSKHLQEVEEFHKTFEHPVANLPTTISPFRAHLRIELIREELNELKQAFDDNDLIAIADALADIQYVLNGTIIECGLQNIFQDLCTEVHRSNMSKLVHGEDIEENIEYYKNKGIAVTLKPSTTPDYYIMFRTEDNKVLKAVGYSPANLEDIIINGK